MAPPSVIAAVSDAYVATDDAGVVRECNRAAETLFGVARDALVGAPLDAVCVPAPSHAAPHDGMHARLVACAPCEGLQVTIQVAGEERGLEVSAWAADAGPEPRHHVLCRDVTEHLRLEQEVLAYARHADMVERLAGLGTWELDVATGAITVASAEVHRILDVDEDATLTYETFVERVHPEERDWMGRVVKAAIDDGTPYALEFRVVQADGAVWWVAAEGERITGAAGRVWLRGTLRDITARKLAELELAALATSDPLTGFANRTRLVDELDRALRASDRTRSPVALLLLDLDGFKPVNDTYGHSIGDEVLITLAQRFADCLRPDATFARAGGDEFAVVVPGADRDDAVAVAQRLVDEAARPIGTSTGQQVRVGASVGIAVAATSAHGAGELRREADLALYAAKRRGRGRLEVFSTALAVSPADTMTVHAADARAWARYVRSLRAAIAEHKRAGVRPEAMRAPDPIHRTLTELLAGIDRLPPDPGTAALILPDPGSLEQFVCHHSMVQHWADSLARKGTLAVSRPLSASRFWSCLQQLALSR